MTSLRFFFVSALIAGCAGTTPPPATVQGSSSDLEARVKRLEEQNAKYAEALEFLGKVYDQQKAQQAQQEESEHDPAAMFAVDITPDLKLGKVSGPASAPVTIVKAFDFACPYCRKMSPLMDELVAEYKGKVRVVYKDMIVHPQIASSAHHAACAAAKQGKYHAFKDAIWIAFDEYAQSRDATKLDEAHLLVSAKTAGLDVKKLKADMTGADCKAHVAADMAELDKFRVTGTPAFFINGTFIGGALPKEGFAEIIDTKLREVEASGVKGADYYDKVVMAKGEKQFRSAKAGNSVRPN